MPAPFELDFVRIINASRLELESAGNPAYAVAVVDADGQAHLAPMVFSTVGPAADHASRLNRVVHNTAEQVVIVSRSAAGRRAMFTVVDPRTLRKLHQRLEVIEETFAELDTTI
jgi:hypothetical protein